MKFVKIASAAVALVALSMLVYTGHAEQSAAGNAKTYDFKDPKGVNGIGFFLNSKYEPFVGTGSGVTGTVTYDPKDPKAMTGSISIAADTLRVTNPTMTEHMHGEQWLNVEANPTITVTFGKVTKVEDGEIGDKLLTVDAKLSAMGLTLDKEIVVGAMYLPDGAKARGGAESGDLLVLRSNFIVTRKDLGIKPEMGGDKVGNEIGIVVGIAGYEK